MTIVMDCLRGGVRESLTVVTVTGLLQLACAACLDAELVGATEKCQALEGRRGSGPGCELQVTRRIPFSELISPSTMLRSFLYPAT